MDIKRFSSFYSNLETDDTNVDKRKWKIKATVEIIIEATNEGEASYLSDTRLGEIEGVETFFIESTQEVFDLQQEKNNFKKI